MINTFMEQITSPAFPFLIMLIAISMTLTSIRKGIERANQLKTYEIGELKVEYLDKTRNEKGDKNNEKSTN